MRAPVHHHDADVGRVADAGLSEHDARFQLQVREGRAFSTRLRQVRGCAEVRCLSMFEDSVESFITQWRQYAAEVYLFSHVEGSPLVECLAAGVIFGVFERTGPYCSSVGRAQLIVHPLTERVERVEEAQRSLKVAGPNKLHAQGLVLLRRGNMVVVDAGLPLVTGSFEDLPDDVAAGDWLAFESTPPVHGFVISKTRRAASPTQDGESI